MCFGLGGKMRKDLRPDEYRYWKQMKAHLKEKTDVFFNGELIYPRQFEIHLPGNHIKRCNLGCPHCAGKYFDHSLGHWEIEGLELLDKLKGKIPYHIYGGAYTEPIINPYYLTYMAMTKKYNNHFGMHINGTLLNWLEENQGWLTELNRISTDPVDYLSVSLDAGLPWSWGITKGTKKIHLFNEIIEGLRKVVNIRSKAGKGHAIRVCYLISPESGTQANFDAIVAIMKDIGVDSLRFSIPFGCYNQNFNKIREYKANRELPWGDKYAEMLSPYLSKTKYERPYIFYTGPEFTDIDLFTFNKCVYGYYQITYGADGYVYKCSTSATPTAKQCRIGKITSDLNEFNEMIKKNYNPNWDCQKNCFAKGVRCNRMGLEINLAYQALGEKDK